MTFRLQVQCSPKKNNKSATEKKKLVAALNHGRSQMGTTQYILLLLQIRCSFKVVILNHIYIFFNNFLGAQSLAHLIAHLTVCNRAISYIQQMAAKKEKNIEP